MVNRKYLGKLFFGVGEEGALIIGAIIIGAHLKEVPEIWVGFIAIIASISFRILRKEFYN